MKMSFDPKVGGIAALEAFQSFAKELDKKYGSRAFQRFRNADMTVLLKT
jgi:hypothetical protein